MTTALDVIKRFLDRTYPEVGLDCPNFPVMVLLFSAALMQTADPGYLEEFTRYRREFIEGIAGNMTNNGLWNAQGYLAASWLQEGHIDEEEFFQQVDAAMGSLWYSEKAAERETVDLIWINPRLRLDDRACSWRRFQKRTYPPPPTA